MAKNSTNSPAPNDELPAVDTLDYETARDELAETVRRLEQGGLSLDDSLALWERGEKLAQRCEELLVGAHKRIEETLEKTVDSEESETGV